MSERNSILVLGIGNILWADEGFGVRTVEAMNEAYAFSENVTVLDGGTQGLYLLPYLQETDRLVVFDAIDWGLPPGMLRVFEGDEVPKFMGAKKMSLHQTGFQEVIMSADLLGKCPRELVLIGVQPVELEDFGGSLRDEVKAQIEPSIKIALEYLEKWGANPTPRKAGEFERLSHISLDINAYEEGRPSEEEACRVADLRFVDGR